MMGRFVPHVAGAVAIIVVIFGIWKVGHNAGANSVQVKWDADTIKRTNQLLARESTYRAKEREWNARAQELQDRLSQAQRDSLTELDTTLADVRGDNLRLRERFRACRMSRDTETPGSDDGASGGGLSGEDQEFLIRIAAEADDVAHRLTACQGYVLSLQ